MRQLVRKEPFSSVGSRRVVTFVEDNIIPHRVSLSVDGLRGPRSAGVCMQSHTAEVVAKSRLHEGASGWVERLARGTQDLVDFGKGRGCVGAAQSSALFLDGPALRHAHHPVGNTVSFPLGGITRGADRQLRLKERLRWASDWRDRKVVCETRRVAREGDILIDRADERVPGIATDACRGRPFRGVCHTRSRTLFLRQADHHRPVAVSVRFPDAASRHRFVDEIIPQ